MKKNLLRTFARGSMFLVCGGCLVFSPLASMSAKASLHEKEPFDFYKMPLLDIIVKGKVTDAKGPIPGVSVKLKGGTATTVTDGSGNFSIKSSRGIEKFTRGSGLFCASFREDYNL